jgi:hypothetical protein
MEYRPQIRLVAVQVIECPSQQRKQLGLVMVGFRAKLDKLDEIGSRLSAAQGRTDPGEWVFQRNLGQRMEVLFPAPRDLNFGLEKQIEFAGKRALRPARALGRGLNAA